MIGVPSSRLRGRWYAKLMSLVVSPALAAMVLPAVGGMVSGPPRPAAPLATAKQKPVAVHAVGTRTVKTPVLTPWKASQTNWPTAGSAVVTVSPSAAARAGDEPVWLQSEASKTSAAPSQVQVTMATHQAALAAGIKGVLFTVRTADGATASQARVSLDYASFADAYNGDYASRLRLVRLPACALTTPKVAACRQQTPVQSTNDVKNAQLAADLTIPAAASKAMVLATTPAPSGSEGNYTATPLSEAGSWAAGDSSGAFTYSYPIQVPPVPGGLEPDVSLNYNSQMVDGLTSSTNNQASWIGDGWDYTPGFIERDYQSCQQSSHKTGDLCWSANDTTTLSLDGTTTTLVQDSSTGTWRAESDGNDKVQYLTGTSNGTHDGDYWEITTPDGTQYYFGLTLPGYASGDTPAQAAWTAPVYATSSGQPCYNATWASSNCAQAWRWMLDYVVDPHQNAIAYLYNKQNNYYAANSGTTGSSSYVQAGALSQIRYGLRAGKIYGYQEAGIVNFTTATNRTDVPTDLTCSSGASCNVQSPTFWSPYELTGITTQSLQGTTWANVDSWALGHTYPATGDPDAPAPLWLSTITRTGQDGTAIALPPVKFSGQAMNNRILTNGETKTGYPPVARVRLTSITSETGGVTTIGYDTPSGACASGSGLPAADANTGLCYPDYWTPPGLTSPVEDWFAKYVVTGVTQQNTAGGGVALTTNYSYGNAAWHYDDDSLTRSQQRTWDQWRGFRTVTTETGTAPDPVTETQATYFQGMNGDYQSDGSTSSVSLTSTRGDTVTDSDQFAGDEFEKITYNGAGSGNEVTDATTIPWSSAATATQTQPSPLPALTAHLTGTAESKTYTALAAGGNRESDITYTHDSYGRVTTESDVPDTSDATEDTCTTTSYASNTTAWILTLPSETSVVSVPCGTTPTLPANAVSDKLAFYDGATSLSADTPTAGNVTMTQQATSYSGTTPVYTTEQKTSYDQYGRAVSATDADNRTTKTAYTPATGPEPTSETVTDPMSLATVTTYDPDRDLPLTVTAPAGYQTTETYDALGRLTAVWKPGMSPTSDPASLKFSYSVSATAPSVVTTDTIAPGGAYTVSETLYDSLARQIESQTETADGNRDVSDTTYNSDGWQLLVSNPYYVTGAPSATLVAATDNQVPSQTGYVYDGAGRVVKQISYKLAGETWETDTTYGGNYTTAVPPSGGTSETTFTNGEGLTSAIYQYHQGVSASPSDPASEFDKTVYSYTPAQQLAAVQDASGNKWAYTYDLLGNQKTQSDPDSGTSTSSYDAASQLMSVTDARNDQTSYTYDADGRKTGEYDTTGGASESAGDELASWTYDTLAKGLLTGSTSYYGGEAYTEQVTKYNGYGLPAGTQTIIPSAEGALAGTYTTTDGYDTYTQAPIGYADSAAGGLPSEGVSIGYDAANQAASVTSSLEYYVESLKYTELGQPQEYTMGTNGSPAWILNSYDEQTGRLSTSQLQSGVSPVTDDSTTYNYDDVGNVTSESDNPSGGPAQDQCFQYDYLGRLSQAWSQGSSDCSAGPSQSAESGATAPYWDVYNYNTVNDLTSVKSTPASGSATTTTDSYPPAGQAQPHAVASQQVSGPSGTATTSYGYDADGHLKLTAGSQSQSLSWDDAGRLSSVSTTAGTTSYLYDADGNLLIQQDPGRETLFLDDEELVLNTSTNTVSGTRYYTLGGVTVAARSSGGQVQYLDGNAQGTSTVAVDAQSMSVTRRYFDPFGNSIGLAPSSWPGAKGFVGGTADTSTGLTNEGAREYDAQTASFISPDSVLNATDPQDLNPYAYAGDNPSTDSDPSGLCMESWCPPPPAHGSNPHPSPYGPGTGRGDGACPPWEAGCSLASAGTGSSHRSSGGDGMLIGHLGIEPTGPTAGMYRQMTQPYKGGITSFMAGMFDSLFGGADLAMDTACVFCALSTGGHSAEDWYKQWLAAHHIPTGDDSWYGAGIGSADVISLLLGAGAGADAGAADAADIGGARFAQKSFSEMFSSGGRFAGQSIDDVAGSLRSGALSPKDVPIDIVVRDGNSLILNTRSSQALIRAGVPRSSWNVIDRTGQAAYEARLSGQLSRNGLTSYGTELP